MGAGDDGLVAIDNKARVVDPGDRVVFLQVVALSPKTARLGCAACSHESDVPAGELMRACKYARPCQYHPHEMTMALLSDGKIIGAPVTQEGCITYPTSDLFLCSSVTNAAYATTTEVYPDSTSKPVTDEQCNRAQVAVIVSGLRFIQAKA